MPYLQSSSRRIEEEKCPVAAITAKQVSRVPVSETAAVSVVAEAEQARGGLIGVS